MQFYIEIDLLRFWFNNNKKEIEAFFQSQKIVSLLHNLYIYFLTSPPAKIHRSINESIPNRRRELLRSSDYIPITSKNPHLGPWLIAVRARMIGVTQSRDTWPRFHSPLCNTGIEDKREKDGKKRRKERDIDENIFSKRCLRKHRRL